MNIVVNTDKFLTALRAVERVISKHASLPILNAILLKTEGDQLRIAATNLDVGMQYWIGAKVTTHGDIALPAKILSDFVSNVPDEKITLTVEKNILSINSISYKTQLLGMETHEFPIIPSVGTTTDAIIIPRSSLKLALSSVIDSVALSDLRPELSGVYLRIQNNSIITAATDSFRLSERIVPFQGSISHACIIPRMTALEMIRVAEMLEEDPAIAIADNQIFLYNNHFQMVSRLIDGNYPDYKKIIPERSITTAVIQKADLEKNIRLASIFSSNISDVSIAVDATSMLISAHHQDRGDINVTIPCALDNEPFTLSLNYRYLLDGLKHLDDGKVFLGYSGDGGPLLVRGEHHPHFLYIIMPLRS